MGGGRNGGAGGWELREGRVLVGGSETEGMRAGSELVGGAGVGGS